MRNLKKVLSLALAMVMLLGMMVVGAGAASFTDDADITHKEAVAVVSGIGVLQGVDDGSKFDPKGTLTRAEAAVVIAKLDLGAAFGNLATTNASTFKDVGTGYGWAKPYIDYCAARGLIAGDGNGYFHPADDVTGVEFALMVSRVLGYEDANESISGPSWEVNAAAVARKAGLTVDVTLGSTAIPRDDMAQVAFNALKADMVEYDGRAITIGDVVIPAGKAEAVKVANEGADNYAGAEGAGDGTKQLCEEKFPTLKLDIAGEDGMKRPANEWSYKSETITKAAAAPNWTTVVSKDQTAAKLVSDHNSGWKMSGTIASVNGGTKATVADTSLIVGDVVEVYMNATNAKQVDAIAVTRYSVGTLSGDVVTKGEGDKLQVRVPGVVGTLTPASKVVGYDGLAKGDVVYYYKDGDGVTTIAKADSFEGTYTGDKTGTPVKHIIEGEEYVVNGNASVTLAKQTTYTVYTDPNGYVIAAKEVEKAESSDYVVIQEIKYAAGTGGITGSQAVEARLVKMDGTAEVVKVKSIQIGNGAENLYVGIDTTDKTNDADGANGNNKWLVYDENTAASAITPKVHSNISNLTGKAFFTYSENNGEYELTKVTGTGISQSALASNAAIVNDKATMTSSGNVAVNRNTVFVVATESGGKSFKVYNGIAEVPNITLGSGDTAVGAYVTKNGIATYVYVGGYNTSDVSGDNVFFTSAAAVSKLSKKIDGKTVYYNTYNAIVDGEYTTVEVKADSNGETAVAHNVAVGLFTPTYDESGMITKIVADSSKGVPAKIGYTWDGGTLIIAGTDTYTCDDDALVFIQKSDGSVDTDTAVGLTKDVNDSVYVVKTSGTGDIVDFLFIVNNAGENAEEAAEESVKDVVGSVEWDVGPASNPDAVYEPVGKFTVSGNTITASGYTKDNMVKGLDDTPRFLGSLYKNGAGVTEIVYNGTTYTWDSTESHASKWYNNSSSLVSAIVSKMQADLGITNGDWTTYHSETERTVTIPLKLNGVDYNYNIVIPAVPADPVSG